MGWLASLKFATATRPEAKITVCNCCTVENFKGVLNAQMTQLCVLPLVAGGVFLVAGGVFLVAGGVFLVAACVFFSGCWWCFFFLVVGGVFFLVAGGVFLVAGKT